MHFGQKQEVMLCPSKCTILRILIHCSFNGVTFFFCCSGSSLLNVQAFLQLWRVGATLQLWCSGFSLQWLVFFWSMDSRRHRLSSCSSQALHKLSSCGAQAQLPEVCGIFLDQGLNPCLLCWQLDSLPLSHQGCPMLFKYYVCCLHGWQVSPIVSGAIQGTILLSRIA